jgi:hypothetical protein
MQTLSRSGTPNGMSMAGWRTVIGSDDPARNGNPSRRASATISAHSFHSVERCLSLNTGTERPESSNTFTHSLNHS